jgi:hypothetical protein
MSARWTTGSLTGIVYAVVFVVLFVAFAAEGLWIDVAIIVVVGLALGLFFLWTPKVVRHAEELPTELPESPVRPPSEVELAIDALDEAVHDARRVPLTDQVRLDRGKAGVLLDRLRIALPSRPSELISIVDELDELIRRAKPIPLTDEIRLDREGVYDILDRMRASLVKTPVE